MDYCDSNFSGVLVTVIFTVILNLGMKSKGNMLGSTS